MDEQWFYVPIYWSGNEANLDEVNNYAYNDWELVQFMVGGPLTGGHREWVFIMRKKFPKGTSQAEIEAQMPT